LRLFRLPKELVDPEFIGNRNIFYISQFQTANVVVDTLVNWKNIYGVDKNFNPIDKNLNINLNQLKIGKSLLSANKSYLTRVRYRDHNLKWSDWSSSFPFKTDGIISDSGTLNDSSNDFFLSQNYPNPYRNNTTITCRIPEMSEVVFRIYDKNSGLVGEISEGIKSKGTYQLKYKGDNLSSGIYFYQMITNKLFITKMMMKIE